MKATDVMTSPAITVGPETSVREIAAILLKGRISAVPVLEAGRLVGIVSEADLLHRHEIGTDRVPAGPWWLRPFTADRSPAEYVKSHAGKARDIMTREVVSVGEDTPVAQVAALLEKRGIRRVPVMRGERLVGIVSRANLVQALAAEARVAARPWPDDDAIQHRLLAELERQSWWRSPYSNVTVTGGIVHFWGATETDEDRDAVRVAAENVPGVRSVEDHRFRLYDIASMV
ncbi:MAG: CBS domain-containing protein [Woeseiaceae bacterium]